MLGLNLNFCQFDTCETNHLDKGLIVFRMGDICKYIVVKGFLSLYLKSPSVN